MIEEVPAEESEDESDQGECQVTTRGGKRAGAGRPFGTTSIRSRVLAMCEEMELNPTKEIIKIIKDKSTDASTRSRLLQDLQQYVAPKLKSIEIKGSLDDDNRPIVLVMYKDLKKEDLDSPI